MKRGLEFSVIVPVYNEEEVLLTSYKRLKKVMEGIGAGYEIIFVNDGSIDATSIILKKICDEDKACKAIQFSRNFGHQPAISAGMEKSKGNAVIVIDADLQDPPEVIPSFIEKWRGGADVVYGKRTKRKGEGVFKKLTSTIFYRFLNSMIDLKIPNDVGDFRLIDRKVCDYLNQLSEKHRYVRGLVSWLGFKQEMVEYVREPRFAGVTKYPLKRMLKFAFDAITSFSNKPLRIASYIGLMISLLGFGYLVYIVCMKLFANSTAEGWASIMSLIIIFNGLILMFLGLLGEYVGRVYDELKDRPLYVIKEVLNDDEDKRKK